MSDTRPILVIGGTRGTGRLVVRLLEERADQVRILARNPSRVKIVASSTVEVIGGDITKPDTLSRALEGVRHIVFTAGIRSGRPATEAMIKRTEHEGVLNTLTAARRAGLAGRFVYMNSSGVTTRSVSTMLLNLYKGNTLEWRRRAEDQIRSSGLDYTVVRAGFLLNRRGGEHALEVTQEVLPLSPRYRVARADVAATIVAALDHPRAVRSTFEVIWSRTGRAELLSTQLDRLRPDVDGLNSLV
jgi:uncharacterized protein YbjT (DUF2867 family)